VDKSGCSLCEACRIKIIPPLKPFHNLLAERIFRVWAIPPLQVHPLLFSQCAEADIMEECHILPNQSADEIATYLERGCPANLIPCILGSLAIVDRESS
jgi:hypothetical protein